MLGNRFYERPPTCDHGRAHDGEGWRGDGLPSKSRRNDALFMLQSPRRSHGVLNEAENSHTSWGLLDSSQAMNVQSESACTATRANR